MAKPSCSTVSTWCPRRATPRATSWWPLGRVGSRATFLADTVLDELQFAHPCWVSAVQVSAEDTIVTRRRLFDEAVRDGNTVARRGAVRMEGARRFRGRGEPIMFAKLCWPAAG